MQQINKDGGTYNLTVNKIASHDSLSGYPLKTWWFYPFTFTARCQTKTVRQQFNSGVRYFDLRVVKYKGEWYGAHGAMIYNVKLKDVLTQLYSLSLTYKSDVYVRIIIEDTFYVKSQARETLANFRLQLLNMVSFNQYLHLHRIGRKSDWENHVELIPIKFYGKNNYMYDEAGINEKLLEIDYIIYSRELSVYEAYTYKGFPKYFGIPYPLWAARRINSQLHAIPQFTMIDFV